MHDHEHKTPVPIAKSKVQITLDSGATLTYDVNRVNVKVDTAGIWIRHYNPFRVPTTVIFYPHHRIQRLDMDEILDEDREAYVRWYAENHNGLSPDEEEELEQNSMGQRIAQGIADRLGIDPDDVDFRGFFG